MNSSLELFAGVASQLGWAVLHSLWQGAVIAALLALSLALLHRHSAAARHVACLVALGTLAFAPAVTIARMRMGPRTSQNPSAVVVNSTGGVPHEADEPSPPTSMLDLPGNNVPAGVAPLTPLPSALPHHSWNSRLEPLLPGITAVWLAGVALLSLRHLGGWWKLRRLRSTGTDASTEIERVFTRLAARFGCHGTVRLREVVDAAVPMLAGVWQPVVLFPARLVTGLSNAELEAILAHELAHLVRRDAWSNLAQVMVETVLFYHPAVWWIGRRARVEREHAADDLALRVCTDRRQYAGALAHLAELESAGTLVLAATGGDLLARIRRIVTGSPAKQTGSWGAGLPALAIVCVFAGVFGLHALADDPPRIQVAPGEPIQAAIDRAPAGAIIRLAAGEWKERVVITKPLTLEGEGWDKTQITIEEPPGAEVTKWLSYLDTQRQAATTPEEKEQAAVAWIEKIARPAITVRGTSSVTVRKLRVQGLSKLGRDNGGTNSTLVYFHRSKAAMHDCAVVGPFGQGIYLTGGSEVSITRSLVAAIWHNGIVVAGRGRDDADQPSRLQLTESEVRNVYHYGIALGRGCDASVIERCRISGTAWHGIRYDDASPTITGNVIFAHARSGIYASGKTHATVRGNLFWKNEMGGMSCWFSNTDTIEGNTFVENLREGLMVIGASKPAVARNTFVRNPIAIACSTTTTRDGQPTPVGDPVLTANLFHDNPIVVQAGKEKRGAPEGSEAADPKFRDAEKQDFAFAPDSPAKRAGMGVSEPLTPIGPWPLLAEEKAIIPEGDTREFRFWTAPGEAKLSKRREDLVLKAQSDAKTWITDAFQLDDTAKRTAAIDGIRAALGAKDPAEVRKALAAFNRITKVAFDKDAFRPALRALLVSTETDLRAGAVNALGLCGVNAEDTDRLAGLADDASPDVRGALPYALKLASNHSFEGKVGAAILRLLDRQDGKATQSVWHAMWGTKISPELEARVVEASRKDDTGSGYSDVFYYALTVHQSKREPTVTRLIALLASPDTVNVAGRVLWGLQQGVALDQEPRVADAAIKILGARDDDYMRRQALACVKAYGKAAHLEPLRVLLARPGVTGDSRTEVETALRAIETRTGN